MRNFVHYVYVIAYTPRCALCPFMSKCCLYYIHTSSVESHNWFIIQSWLIALHSTAHTQSQIELLFSFSSSSSCFTYSFLSTFTHRSALCDPIYGLLPVGMTHACFCTGPSPVLDPHPIFTFCVFDVFANISQQLSGHVSYRPEVSFPWCPNAGGRGLWSRLRLRLCGFFSMKIWIHSWSIIMHR